MSTQSKTLKEILSQALSVITNGGALPDTEPDNATSAAAMLLLSVIDTWMNEYHAPISLKVDAVVKHVLNKDDSVVQCMSVSERQTLWMIVNMLRKERERRAKGKS